MRKLETINNLINSKHMKKIIIGIVAVVLIVVEFLTWQKFQPADSQRAD